MDNSFFLQIFPGRSLTIHVGRHLGRQGLSLRGSCLGAADAPQLERAIDELLHTHLTEAWIDGRLLHRLSWQGCCALWRAHHRAQAAGLCLHWCGLPSWLHAQLAAVSICLLPAAAFAGPAFLLPREAALA